MHFKCNVCRIMNAEICFWLRLQPYRLLADTHYLKNTGVYHVDFRISNVYYQIKVRD